MGNCLGTPTNNVPPPATPEEAKKRQEEKEINRKIEADMKTDVKKERRVNRLLLLGTGESGKSTLFKQAKNLYGAKFTLEEQKQFVQVISWNCLEGMQAMIRYAESQGYADFKEQEDSREYVMKLEYAPDTLDVELATHLQKLWATQSIKRAYEDRSKYQLQDTINQFMDRVMAFAQPGFIPSLADILLCRRQTTGVVELELTMKNQKIKLVDVGGQRNERRKWINQFDKCHAVIFVTAINEYDQVLYEDNETNRLKESLFLFDEICNCRWFEQTNMILFLNKKDLFQDKLMNKKIDLNVCFPEYTGGLDYAAAVDFLKNEYRLRNQNSQKVIYTHVTCATDPENVEKVFQALADIILSNVMEQSGFF
eukprot:TRINITY_DN14926_c0_g2_i1.p1 TRINITY_DN14926_c0_g2~~TRINITY_DN14926_c0_g2_i1.p1  ORF type:complete len:368 (+),score=78.70 TRINITY_DN14926_c0_g2_i1:340-1443(+)